MIGQKNLINLIAQQIESGKFPRFSIIVGQKGSGKKTLCSNIAEYLDVFWCFEPDNKVETVRNAIRDAYRVGASTMYVFTDVDNMSVNAKNALLKVTEEPPNNAYFIMTVSNENTLLDTIKSRASIYHMESYTESQILEYAQGKYNKIREVGIIAELCEVPGDVDKLYEIGAEKLFSFVEKVVDNIADVSTANALKIAENIAFKEGDSGYDIELFLRAFRSICAKRMKDAVADKDAETQMLYSDGIKIVSTTLASLNTTGINKGALFDIFILDIRKEWL